MSRWREVTHRVRRNARFATRDDVAALREDIAQLGFTVQHLAGTVNALNHDVRSGSAEGLPLFLGYAERFRTDADTVVGAAEVVDRQLRRLEEQLDRLTVRPTTSDG